MIGGVLVWWLPTAGGPLDKKSPDVRIAALSTLPVARVGDAPAASVTVRNEGDGAATYTEAGSVTMAAKLACEGTESPVVRDSVTVR